MEPNPFLLHLQARRGRLAFLRRADPKMIAVALLVHGLVLYALWTVGLEGVIPLFLVFDGVVLLMAVTSILGTIRRRVEAARRDGAWDEFLLTPLTDREIVNGQLLLALRPALDLLRLCSPALGVMLMAAVASIYGAHGFGAGTVMVTGFLGLVAAAHGLAAVLVYCLGILAFQSALAPRGFLARALMGVFALVLLIALPLLAVVFFPLAALVPSLAWYQHRALCCSLRQRLLQGR